MTYLSSDEASGTPMSYAIVHNDKDQQLEPLDYGDISTDFGIGGSNGYNPSSSHRPATLPSSSNGSAFVAGYIDEGGDSRAPKSGSSCPCYQNIEQMTSAEPSEASSLISHDSNTDCSCSHHQLCTNDSSSSPIINLSPIPPKRENVDHQAAINQAYKVILRHFQGEQITLQDCPPLYIGNQRSYEELYHKLSQHPGLVDHYSYGVRKSWDEETGWLRLELMSPPTDIHEVLVNKLFIAINREIRNAATDNSLADSLIPCGTSSIASYTPLSARPTKVFSPDGQLKHIANHKPHVIWEVAYSQEGDNLEEKVNGYIAQFPKSQLGTIIIIQLSYQDPKIRLSSPHSHHATASVWKTVTCGEPTIRRVLRKAVVRDMDGRVGTGKINLAFEDFIPLNIRKEVPESTRNHPVSITFAELAEALYQGEVFQNRKDKEARGPPEDAPRYSLRPCVKRTGS